MRVATSLPALQGLASLAGFASASLPANNMNETGIYHVDAVFPRNETYATSPHMPIIFAFRNTGIARYIESQYHFDLYNHEQNQTYSLDHRVSPDSNVLDDPHFDYIGYTWMSIEGHWTLTWSFQFSSCEPDPVHKTSSTVAGGQVEFTTKNTTKELDIAAALKNDTCVGSAGGVSLDVTQLVDRPDNSSFQWGRCAVVAETATTKTACPVQIDAKAAESISADLETSICYGGGAGENFDGCRVPSSARQSAMLGGVASAWSVAAVLGGLAYLLVLS